MHICAFSKYETGFLHYFFVPTNESKLGYN